MTLDQNKRIVTQLWNHLYSRSWDELKLLLSDDCWHEDVSAPDPGARGPDNIIERVRIGFDHIERFEHDVLCIVADGNHVVVEHVERWYFKTREVVENRLVSIHEVTDGKISLWRDYWDISAMIAQAPQWWVEMVAEASPRDFT